MYVWKKRIKKKKKPDPAEKKYKVICDLYLLPIPIFGKATKIF